MTQERGFWEISVARLGFQTAAQRFGTSHNPPVQPSDDSDSEDEQDIEDTQSWPRIEEWKMNLTALSQYFNLYFAAYGDKIFVYRPQNPAQGLPREPDLILEPPQSKEAVRRNLMIRHRGHSINHLVVGNLGNKEILLCSYHDGDVIAYYTQTVEYALCNTLADDKSTVKCMFAENVGESAWGLAIHSQSRLIAVGSNAHAIQVFAFALSRSGCRLPHTPRPGHERFPKTRQSDLPRDGGRVLRTQNFRLVFNLSPIGDNVPSLAFSESAEGYADTIVAADIKGALWFFRLWEDGFKRQMSVDEPPDPHRNPIGWGVLILPRDFFKPTYDVANTFGWPKSLSSLLAREGLIDISKTVQKVRDSTVWHEIYDTDTADEDEEENDEEDEEEEDGDDDGEEEEASSEELDNYIGGVLQNAGDHSDVGLDMFGYQGLETFLAETSVWMSPMTQEHDTDMIESEGQMADVPSTSQPPQIIMDQVTPTLEYSLLAHSKTIIKSDGDAFQLSRSGEHILQSYQHHITLCPTQDESLPIPTQCDNILRQEFPHDVWFPRPLPEYDRLNMLAAIPELSLVLVASQIGRVALITITRLVHRVGDIVSMRVDLVLPFKFEESGEKIRPSHGLLGMAVGPMQGQRTKMAARGGSDGPKRWRLMLHYYNHTILSYEISREEETGELLVL